MANINNIKLAIKVMERVAKAGKRYLDMYNWQTGNKMSDINHPKYSLEELKSCGTAACFAGHLTLAPEFKDQGLQVGGSGLPIITCRAGATDTMGIEAIRKLLGLSYEETCLLCAAGKGFDTTPYYGVPIEQVTPRKVINKLKKILAREEAAQNEQDTNT